MSGGWISNLWREVRRRKVTRVVMAYAVVAWGAVQVADIALPRLGIPAWAVSLVIVLVVLGFPVALVLAWAYDITPDGVRRTGGMEPGDPDWRDVQRVLTAALNLPPAQRPAFLLRACAGEDELRREVESLLAAHHRATLLDRPAADFAAPLLQPPAESNPSRGRQIANYQILEKLGGGGMGVVYKARDPRLERIVALKFLPLHLSADERAKERFLVEAQAAAALDHPNICTIHEIGETEDGHLFLAMPFYEGDTLKQRIARGPLPPEEAVELAVQVARGLAKAHERGIVHRDVKPANLVLTSEQVVKIVDFGVAKLADVSVTNPGMTPGTLAYMSPEQAEGGEVDGRTDLWSLGVVLYEMLTGERPFRGSTEGALLQSILTDEPRALSSLARGVPLGLERVVLRALAKRPEERYRTAREMGEALAAALRGESTRTAPVAPAGAPPQDVAPDSARESTAGGTFDSGELGLSTVLPEGERRQATVVSATLSGFDALVEALVPAEMEEMLDHLRTVAESVASRNGGVLNQLEGEEMVLLFGIPASHEDDAVRAVRAALELRDRICALAGQVRSRGAEPLRLHVGVDTGRLVARPGGGERSYTVAGGPTQLAGRLAAQAGPDEVWVSSECHHLIAPFFDTVPEAPLNVRDRKQPVIPFRVVGESGLHTRLEAAEKTGLTAYIGREAELETLSRCLSEALAGEGQMVAVVGEAGMGKSRLLHEFRHLAREAGVTLLLGRCQAHGSGVAYLPFTEILRDGIGLGEGSGGDSAETAVARVLEISPELEEFVPLYLHLLSIATPRHPVPRHLQGDAFRLAIQEALAGILTATAENQPAIVFLEDWHWADEASQAVLKGLSQAVGGYRLLVVVTSRPGYGVDLGDPGQHSTISLRPLEPASSLEVLRSHLRVERFPSQLAELLHERTGGNPFFLEEVGQSLVEEGALRVQDGEARLTGPLQMLDLPDSVQAVIRSRLDRIERHPRDVLRLAAVVGREFSRGILDLTVPEPETLAAALETLKTAGLIQQTRVGRDPVYRFKHILTQEVAYGSLLEHQRRELHGRVGAAIEQLSSEQLDEHLERLAHHFSRAEEWEKAARYGLRSAARTSGLAQFPEALQILERTQRWLARLPAGAERRDVHIQILLHQERLCETLGLRSRQQQIIDELISLLEPGRDEEELAEAYLRQGDLYTLLRRFDEAEAALDRSLAIRRELGDAVGERNTLRSLGLLRWHEGRNAEALEIVQQALRLDRQRQDVVGIVGDLTNAGAILRSLGELDDARTALEEALQLCEDARGEGEGGMEDELTIKLVYVLQHLANVHREQGNHPRALDCLHRAGEVAQAKRLPIQLSYHYTSLAHVHLLNGDTEQSLHYYREAVDLTRKARYAPGLAQSLRILGEVLLGLGQTGEAVEALEEAAAVFAQLEDTEDEVMMWSKIAAAREAREELADAAEAWRRAAALRKQLRDRAGEMEAVEGLARIIRAQVVDAAAAMPHYLRALELALELGDAGAEGRLRNTLGILEWEGGRYDRSLPHFQRALEIYERLGDQVHAGLMLNSLGVSLKQLRRWREARETLEAAVARNRATGERQLVAHALGALGDVYAELGDTPRAAERYRESLGIRRAIGDVRGEGWMLLSLSRILGESDTLEGGELLSQAAHIARACGDEELASSCAKLQGIPA